MKTDPLEMDHLVSSDPLFPNNLPPYVVYHSDFNATEKYHTYLGKDSKKFKITRKKSNCYHKYTFTTAYFCIMKQKKMKQTNWTQMLKEKEYKYTFTMGYFCLRINFKEGFQWILGSTITQFKCVLYSFYWTFGSASCCQIKGNMISKAIF